LLIAAVAGPHHITSDFVELIATGTEDMVEALGQRLAEALAQATGKQFPEHASLKFSVAALDGLFERSAGKLIFRRDPEESGNATAQLHCRVTRAAAELLSTLDLGAAPLKPSRPGLK
jgi:hypothetical protein